MPKRWQPKRNPLAPWALFSAVFTSTVGFGLAYTGGWFDGISNRLAAGTPLELEGDAPGMTGERVSFSFCHVGGGSNCVVDGDTIWLKGEKIRIADIDTPETHDFQCAAEKELGDRATIRLREVLESGAITLGSIDRDEDQYGRKLRIVMVDGESVGETLVNDGLARWYEGGRRPWC